MFDWVNSQATFVIALVGVIVLAVLARTWRRRTLDRAVHNVENGVTADQVGNPHVEKMILSQSVELHFDAPLEVVEPLLAQVRMPMLFNRIGETGWGDRKTEQEAQSFGRLEVLGNRTRARMLWGQDSNGMPVIESDWRALRKRLTKAATDAGIAVTEHQGARMRRTPIEDLPHYLGPHQAALGQHRWQSAEG